MIQYFNTEAEYAAASKSAFESGISLVGADNGIHFDGVNVVVGLKFAKTGSVCVLDGNSAMHFISVDTFSSNSFFSSFTIVGPVLLGVDHPDFRGTVVIGNKTSADKAWSYIYSFRLTGFTCDGTDRTGILSIRTSDAWGTAKDFAVSYNAETVASLVEQLNTFFSADTQYTPSGGSAMDNPFKTQDWAAIGVDTDNDDAVDAIDLVFHLTSYQQASNAGKTGFTLTANLLPEITASTAMIRKNGQRTGEGCILNWDRAIAYFSADLNNATYNPTSNVTSPVRSYPICKPGYLGTSSYSGGSDRCAALRAIYGEGEAGWLKFMESFLPVYPTKQGQFGKSFGDTRTNTYKMAGKTFTKQDGSVVAAFPAARYCADVSYNHDLLRKGQWCLPDIETLCSILKTIKYNTTNNRNADPINRALYAIGGTAISNGTNAWSCSRYVAYYAWFFYGSNGCAYYGNFVYGSFRALPVVLLDVNEVNV